MDKNTLITIVKKEDDKIVDVQRLLVESYDNIGDIPSGWEFIDDRPVIMVKQGNNWVEEVNPNYNASAMEEINQLNKNTGE